MSMLEKMARQLATDALNRVQVDTYTNVVDEIWLYRTGNATYRVSDYPGITNGGTPVLTFADACETMVAMMAEQAGALVVVPEDAPMDSHLAQIAQLLVDSADVPTDAQDVADGAAIVGTVKQALDWLTKARVATADQRRTIDSLSTMLEECRGMNRTAQTEIDRLNNQIQRWNTGANELQDKYLAAQQEIGTLTAKLEDAKRRLQRSVDEAANREARYEAMTEALSLAMDKLASK